MLYLEAEIFMLEYFKDAKEGWDKSWAVRNHGRPIYGVREDADPVPVIWRNGAVPFHDAIPFMRFIG